MGSLHEFLTSDGVRRNGWDGMRENEDYPKGIAIGQLSRVSERWTNTMVLIPADIVPKSQTAKRIAEAGDNLSNYHVVYCFFRRGCGSDTGYG